MRYTSTTAAPLLAGVVAILAPSAAGAQAKPYVAPRSLPVVPVIGVPAFTPGTAEEAHMRRVLRSRQQLRRTAGNEVSLPGNEASIEAEQDALARRRAADSAAIRALHLKTVDADPRP